MEIISKFEDAIKEYDDTDSEEHHKKMTVSIDLIVQNTVNLGFNHPHFETGQEIFLDYNAYLKSSFQKLSTPSPKI